MPINDMSDKTATAVKTVRIGFRRNFSKAIERLSQCDCETLVLEDVPSIPKLSLIKLHCVRKLIIKNVGLLFNGSIFGIDGMETLEIVGSVGYMDSGCISHCRNLRSITIKANIFTSDDYLCIAYCDKLSSIKIRGVFPPNFIHVTDNYRTYFDNFKVKGKSKFPFENLCDTYSDKSSEEREEIKRSLLATSKWANRTYGHDKYIDDAINEGASYIWHMIADIFGTWTRAYKLRKIGWEYHKEHDNPTVKSLKLSGPYKAEEENREIIFRYASIYGRNFELNRRRFHLWKRAGKGSDVDKMIRLCQWIHKAIRHKGDAIPGGSLSLSPLMAATAICGKPGNCFIQSICLTEALLSIGIKARYIKGYRRKNDVRYYHVFVAAWSRKYKKWIFLDPTYGAYVMDADGNLLSPSEIRYNLINDIPMSVNEDADYNGNKDAAKTYLNNFLAQYLYYMTSNTISQDSTEGPSNHVQGEWVTLKPVEPFYRYFVGEKTTDENLFWQPPE